MKYTTVRTPLRTAEHGGDGKRFGKGFLQSGVPRQKNSGTATCDTRSNRKPGFAGLSQSGFGYHSDRLRLPLPPKL